ncbi:MAG: ABC transporter substrate-binding protein [Chlorobiaceae bacterium]|nr:ABC transporter substrate-binding protein [Chlorobiaceae bacterium]
MSEGRAALEQHKVDAWSGIQPFTTLSQMECGSREIYRNCLYNKAVGCLVVSEDFARKYPDAVLRVIRVYERARKWALRHPDDLEVMYADEAKLSLPVARVLLSRYDFLNPAIDRNDLSTLRLTCAILKQEQSVSPDTDLDKVMNDLIDMSFIIKEIDGEEIRQ